MSLHYSLLPMTSIRSKGFSLIELMLVLLLIGMASGGVAIAISHVGSADKNLRDKGQALFRQMRFASDEALMQQRLIGLSFEEEEGVTAYHWVYYHDDKWNALDEPLPTVTLPDDIALQLIVEDELSDQLLTTNLNILGDDEADPPDVLFYPNTDISEFEIELTLKEASKELYRIYINERGELDTSTTRKADL